MQIGTIRRLSGCVLSLTFSAVTLCGCGGGSTGSSSADPIPPTFSVSGTISGLNGNGLTLTVNGHVITVTSGSTNVVLASGLNSGTTYGVTVTTQPMGQTCSVANGNGTLGSANIANVVVTCADRAYPLGGSISGLNSSGLVLANGSDKLSILAGATSFTLPIPVAYTSGYAVTVQNQPAGLACSVSNSSGTMPAGAVTNIIVSCTDQPFSVGGTVAGLGNNSGLVLINGTDALSVPGGASSFTMPTKIAFSYPYAVTARSSPAGETCSVANGSGTMAAKNVTNISVTCSDQAYALGGTISGLSGSGLVLANGTDTLSIASGATSFTMPAEVAFTSGYAIAVQVQPDGETCSVSRGIGIMPAGPVTTVAVNCAVNTYTIGGTISGLSASGLTLTDNGSDATAIAANATQFTMSTSVAYGGTYAIAVQAQPSGETCRANNDSGSVSGNVANVSITCAPWSIFTFSVLYAFIGSPNDGSNPDSALIQASDGNFYGTAPSGGLTGLGTVFQLTSGGAETVLYSFTGHPDGREPFAALIQGSDGNFYGTTTSGGTGDGTIFQITPAGVETVLHSFAGGSDGSQPQAGLLQGSDGNFYGTTLYGGGNNAGTVFKLTSAGVETVLYSFGGGGDGSLPYGSLTQGSDGNLYGTTHSGGANGNGTVFKITLVGQETVLYSFANGGDGSQPYGGLIQGIDGNFYGTTTAGGTNNIGTVFKITPLGVETVIYSFGGSGDGDQPYAALLQASDGNFYGTTIAGGMDNLGTVFRITPTGAETVIHSFDGSDGSLPFAPLIQGSDGRLYGTASGGGFGAAFTITPQ